MSFTDSPSAGHTANSNLETCNREALPCGTQLGDFEILRTIGSGGFGIVYLAHDRSLDREVAIKEFLPSQLAFRSPDRQRVTLRSTSFEANYGAGLRSFVNEAKILAQFNHPGIVKVHRFWEANGTAYMVMSYVHGPTLRDVRRSMKTPPTEAWLRGVLDPMLDVLAMLHAEGIYHRDVAPDNILLPSARAPVLLDFGAARRVIGDSTQTFTAVLKPSYAPIEQYAEAKQLRQGPWTDLYALGAVVVYLLKAVAPPPSTVRSMHDEVPMLLEDPPAGVSASFLCAVQWALAVRPQDRPQSVQQFRNALDGRISASLIARRDHVLGDDAGKLLDLPTQPTVTQAEAAWSEPGMVGQTTVAFAMHGDAPAFEKPELATWDTTLKLASIAPLAAAASTGPPAPSLETAAQVPSTPSPVQAQFARWRLAALKLPRSTMLAASAAVLMVSGAAFALLTSRTPQPTAAMWHELGQHAKVAEVILEEKEFESRPYQPTTTAVSSKGSMVMPAPVSTATAISPIMASGTTTTSSPMPGRADVTPLRQAVSEVGLPPQPAERRAKKTSRIKSGKVLAPSPHEICSDRNFLSAAICMNRRCDESKYQKHPQCVTLLQQREANKQRWQY